LCMKGRKGGEIPSSLRLAHALQAVSKPTRCAARCDDGWCRAIDLHRFL